MYFMCTLFANLYVLSMCGPQMVYHGDPRSGWFGNKKKSIAKTISLHNIYLIWYRYVYPRFHGNVRNPS